MKKKILYDALTYDDVLVVPAYSATLPKDVSTRVSLCKGIELRIPLLSAAMDTVSESQMAVALALAGGLSVIHRNMSAQVQAQQVKEVKRSQSGMILDPVCLPTSATTGEAMRLMKQHAIGGIPVVDKAMRLKGIITHRDLRFEKNTALPIVEAMTPNPVTLQTDKDLEEAKELLQKHKIEKLPITDRDGKLKGLITYKDILKRKRSPYACEDSYGRLCVGGAVGTGEEELQRAHLLVEAGVDLLCVDTAHAHSAGVLETVALLRKKHSQTPLMVGNIATAEAALALADAGADVVKVGIGPGSICTTRVVAGVGVPQLSAVMAVAEALKDSAVRVVADGGIRYSGDVVKALVGGAHVVMLGSLLAGTEEAPGDMVLLQGKKYKTYRGMGSVEAMQAGSKARYFQEGTDADKLVPEGIMGRIPYRGHVHEVIYQIVGGLRAGMGYCGATVLDDLHKASFIRISAASYKEGHPHDITITHEAPNYFSF